ncbi:hypothetical protein ABPG77_006709 [Micractinium sp. CCAP 211/92]
MKFELNEGAVLRLNGAAMVAMGAPVVACPRAHADEAFSSSAGYSEPMLRNFGAALGWLGAEQLVLSARDHSQGLVPLEWVPEGSSCSPHTPRHSYSPLFSITLLLRAAKKDLLKVAGLGWLAASVDSLRDLRKDYKPRELVYASVAAKAVLGGLSLWKGFERSSCNGTGSRSSAGWRRQAAAKEDKRLGPSDKSQPSFLPIDLFGFE